MSYNTPKQFMNLYTVYTGGAPTTIASHLSASFKQSDPEGPLIIVNNSHVTAYDIHTGARKGFASYRIDPTSGFFEATSVSHIGPALSYLATLIDGASSDDAASTTDWVSLAHALYSGAYQLYQWFQTDDAGKTWPSQIAGPNTAWGSRDIRSLFLYALRHGMAYIAAKLTDYAAADDQAGFKWGPDGAAKDLADNFFADAEDAGAKGALGYNNIMVGTFALAGIVSVRTTVQKIAEIGLTAEEWQHARVLIMSRAGSNFSAGLTEKTNYWYPILRLASGFKAGTTEYTFGDLNLPANRIVLSPYADMLEVPAGQDPPANLDVYQSSAGQTWTNLERNSAYKGLDYYLNYVWGALYYQTQAAAEVYPSELAECADLFGEKLSSSGFPGHWYDPSLGDAARVFCGPRAVEKAGGRWQPVASPTRKDIIENLMLRVVQSFSSNKEMLSNSIAFWLLGAAANAGADPANGKLGWSWDEIELPGVDNTDYAGQLALYTDEPADPSTLPSSR